jgi:hypothetical protein
MRPFAEAGFGKSSDGKTEALYGVGAALMLERQLHVAHLTYGGLGMYRNSYTSGDEYDGHGTFEAGIDTQVSTGLFDWKESGPRRRLRHRAEVRWAGSLAQKPGDAHD